MRGNWLWLIIMYVVKMISIHASTWEATGIFWGIYESHWDFNSCLYMRGNLYNQGLLRSNENFNSCLYMRGNLPFALWYVGICISIHASTWEATFSVSWYKTGGIIFQFMPLNERQRPKMSLRRRQKAFQFMPLHERQHFCLITL